MDDILITVVLYKKSIDESITLNSLMDIPLNFKIVIYNNSALDDEVSSKYILSNLEVYYLPQRNVGLSESYNNSFRIAQELNLKYLLFLDDDTLLSEKYFVDLKKVMNFNFKGIIVPRLICNNRIISPYRSFFSEGFLLRRKIQGICPAKNFSVFNSGLCIPLSIFEKIGGYNENVPLYYSDVVFFYEYKKKYTNFLVLDVDIQHAYSALSSKQSLEFKICRFDKILNGAFSAMKYLPFKRFMIIFFFLKAFKYTLVHRNHLFLRIYFKKYIL